MMIKRNIIGKTKFTNTKICEDFFFKCKLLKKVGHAFCLDQYLTNYRIRKNSLQSSNLRNLYWISISLTFDEKFKFLIPLSIVLVPAFLALFYG